RAPWSSARARRRRRRGSPDRGRRAADGWVAGSPRVTAQIGEGVWVPAHGASMLVISATTIAIPCGIRQPVGMYPDTVAVHSGREDFAALGVHAAPIDLSSTNPLPDIEHGGDSYESMATGGRPLPEGGMVYQRLWNPTVARFEGAL